MGITRAYMISYMSHACKASPKKDGMHIDFCVAPLQLFCLNSSMAWKREGTTWDFLDRVVFQRGLAERERGSIAWQRKRCGKIGRQIISLERDIYAWEIMGVHSGKDIFSITIVWDLFSNWMIGRLAMWGILALDYRRPIRVYWVTIEYLLGYHQKTNAIQPVK